MEEGRWEDLGGSDQIVSIRVFRSLRKTPIGLSLEE